MNPYMPNQKQPYKLKVPVIVLSFIALALGLVRFFIDLQMYLDTKEYWDPTNHTFAMISLFVYIIPFLTWFVYTLLPRNLSKATILVAITAVFVAAKSVMYYVTALTAEDSFSYFTTFDYIFDALTLVTFTLAAVQACMGLSKKVFLILAAFVGIVPEAYYLVQFFQDLEWLLDDGWYTTGELIGWGCQYAAPIFMFVAMLLFSAVNRFKPHLTDAQRHAGRMDPEVEIRLLCGKLEQGLITPEEYQARRARIIQDL